MNSAYQSKVRRGVRGEAGIKLELVLKNIEHLK